MVRKKLKKVSRRAEHKVKEKVKEMVKSTPVDKIKTGIPGFDDLLTKGIPRGSSVLVEGSAGTGKTIFCLQIAHNACKRGEKALYMSFEEAEERLIKHMEDFGWEPRKWIKKGLLRIKRYNALDIARSVEALLSEAKRELLIDVQPVFFPEDFKADIVCMDSLSAVGSAFAGEMSRFRIYMEQLFKYLEKRDITSFLIRERSHPAHAPGAVIGFQYEEAVSFLSDGIIVIYNILSQTGARGSAIEILKLRGEGFQKKIIKMKIMHGKGIVAYPNKVIGEGFTLT